MFSRSQRNWSYLSKKSTLIFKIKVNYLKKSSSRFYPTKLASILSSSGEMNTKPSEGYIIIESNYRVYAYTSSELQTSILGSFVKWKYFLPGLAVGLITRKTIRTALINGISAEKIIKYLKDNVHPEMKKKVPAIPETITDQIRLWEAERTRVSYDRGVLYENFTSNEQFEKVVKYAKDIGFLIWAEPTQKLLVVSDSGHDLMRHFIKSI